jgi:hypothetical protein
MKPEEDESSEETVAPGEGVEGEAGREGGD